MLSFEVKIIEYNLSQCKTIDLPSKIHTVFQEFPELIGVYDLIAVIFASKRQFMDKTVDGRVMEILNQPSVSFKGVTPFPNRGARSFGLKKERKGCLMLVSDILEEMSPLEQLNIIRHECCHLLYPSARLTSVEAAFVRKHPYLFSKLREIRREYLVDGEMIKRYPEDWVKNPLRIIPPKISMEESYKRMREFYGISSSAFLGFLKSVEILRVIYVYERLFSTYSEIPPHFETELERYREYLGVCQKCLEQDLSMRVQLVDWLKPEHFESEKAFFDRASSLIDSLGIEKLKD